MRPAGRGDERAAAATPADAAATATRNATGDTGDAALSARTPAPGRRRELGPVQDQALYTCECGFVFKAPVSTSVGCPHCGDAQAW